MLIVARIALMAQSPITFVRKNTDPSQQYFLYAVADCAETQPTFLYYLTWNTNKQFPGQAFPFANALQYNGIFIFATPADFATTTNPQSLFAALGALSSGISIAWLTNPQLGQNFSFQVLQMPIPTRTDTQASGILSSFALKFANLSIGLGRITDKAPTLTIDSISQSVRIFLATNTTAAFSNSNTTSVLSLSPAGGGTPDFTIPFAIAPDAVAASDLPDPTTASGGTLYFSTPRWTLSTLYTLVNGTLDAYWGGAIRYYFPNLGSYTRLTFPVFDIVMPGNLAAVNFTAQLDFLHPTYAAQSYLLVNDPSQASSVFESPNLGGFSVIGDNISWKAAGNLGYYFTAVNTASQSFYLSPFGRYGLQLPGNQSQTKWMPGLTPSEFMIVQTNAYVELVPNQPAYAPGFNTDGTPTSEEDEPILTNKFLTSWLYLHARDPQGQWSYYSQPQALPVFGNETQAPNAAFSITNGLDVKIGDFPTAPGGEPPVFPIALYRNAFTANSLTPNPGIADLTFSAFEKQILAGTRYNTFITEAESGFGPVFSPSNDTPIAGGRIVASNGFLMDLNTGTGAAAETATAAPAGTAAKLRLARSGADYLSFNANAKGIVDAYLSTALMNNQGFLVINDWQKFPLDPSLTVSGFTFNVQPVTVGTTPIVPIMVFKFSQTQSLKDLINTTAAWTDPAYFLLGGDVSIVQQALQDALKKAQNAQNSPDDPFQYFREVIASDPDWTGMIVFNCPIDGNNMPDDFKMLFAGVDGPLTAHHFGVELNQIGISNGQPDIDKSSLFGVIYYENETTPDAGKTYEFIVGELIVEFRNSTILAFHASAGLMINQLFGRDVILQQEATSNALPNTFFIQGRYQKSGDQGTVSFTSTDRYVFAFNPDQNYVRVLDQYVITGADLVPIGTTDNSDQTQTVQSRFSLDAQLFFAADPIPGKTDVPDIFSYGVEDVAGDKGLPLTGTAFNIRVILDKEGQAIPDSRSTTIDTSGFAVQAEKAAVRPTGLLNAMPFKLAGILQASEGKSLDIKSFGQVVEVSQLQGNVTNSPWYALQFDLPLGTLGSLSEVGASIDSTMYLAWGPNDATPDNDGASLYIQLPEASAGLFGFNLEGIVKTVFGDANLMKVDTDQNETGFVYVLLFNNVAISILGIKLPPKVITDFIVFADPVKGFGSNMAWNVAATQVTAQNSM